MPKPDDAVIDDPEGRAPPLDDDAFAASMARFEPFEDAPFLAVAVSGGADSLALTLLADRWARDRGGRAVGLTVDHGLRSGSATEARQTGVWLQARGIEHHTLVWRGDKPTSALQHRARDARYALLTDWCRLQGCFHLLTAHHRQDQAETVVLRKARRSGGAGLAGIAAAREIPGLRLLRPLLGIDKTSLQAWLRARDQPWLDDPSNDNPAFTRNRLRQAGLDVPALADEAETHGRMRQEAERRAADTLVRHATIDPAGFARLDARGFERLPSDLALDLLTRLLMTIGGRVYPPRSEALARLLEAMRGGVAAPGEGGGGSRAGATLAHCRILNDRGGWLICPERVSSERIALVSGRRQRWDGRFVVDLHMPRPNLVIGALVRRSRLAEDTLTPKGKARSLPGVVRPTLPSIYEGDRLVAVPHLGLYARSFAPEHIDMLFSPRTPLANAPFIPHISG